MIKTAQQFIDEINDACEPGKMNKKEAMEFLDEIASSLNACIDCLVEEIANED